MAAVKQEWLLSCWGRGGCCCTCSKELPGVCRCQAADLSKNGIGVRGTTALVEALQQNETLQTLVLDTNSIGDEGAEILAKHLSSAAPSDILAMLDLGIHHQVACIVCMGLHRQPIS